MNRSPSMEDKSPTGVRSPLKSAVQQSLSCTLCRQRKIKCDKVHPCSGCNRSGLACVFPERARNPKKQRNGSKASNKELIRRLNRMEELIGKIEGEGEGSTEYKSMGISKPKEVDTTPSTTSDQSQTSSNGVGYADDSLNRYIGSTFWRTLTCEVGVLIPMRKACL